MADEDVLRCLLIRHGHTESNGTGSYVGVDDPLSELGREQARLLGAALNRSCLDTIVHSPCLRAIETMMPILDGVSVQHVLAEARLREGDVGEWTGQPMGLRAKMVNATTPLWAVRPPGGESYLDIDARLEPVVRAIREGDYGSSVALVAHGRVNSLILRRMQDVPWEDYVGKQMRHASVTEFLFGPDGYRLVRLEDVAHLEPSMVTV
ncbi:histidine phosphatase family protein [Nocardioides immobilis]|uniref:Histidine phosphatase family protein n=1 Tax=Nocardioides immobilis TaxID=2049295 RepID=A0A417XYK3_9ACTN|nr:histidine phosphatase family protein [Nocardioides immobilis]RHW25444.1 histidine phosphatase family protein [Nocardioides immobilis]